MARHLYLHDEIGYVGELALYRAAHVGASRAQASADLPGLRPGFLFRVKDGEQTRIMDDEVAVYRYVHDHPGAIVTTVPLRH